MNRITFVATVIVLLSVISPSFARGHKSGGGHGGGRKHLIGCYVVNKESMSG